MTHYPHLMAWTAAVMPLLTLAACSTEAQTAASGVQQARPDSLLVYVGTYTGNKSKGIQAFRMDLPSGSLSPLGCVAEITHPTFLAIHPSQRLLYSVSEIENFNRTRSGAVAAFAIDPATGKLTPLNKQPSGGGGACHVSVDKAGKHLLVANYSGGNASAFPIQADGTLSPASAFVQHTGAGPNKERQEKAHAHSINLDPANRFAFVTDLGIDKVMVYRFDAAQGTLTANDPPFAAATPGSGPRHLAFHPNGRFVYVNGELDGSVMVFAFDADRGTLTSIQSAPTLPADFAGQNTTAEVQVHPSGKFLYVSNRGHDSIAMFSIDPQTGRLTALGHEPTGGKEPRNFGIDPTGAYLIAANQGSDTLVVFRIDPQSGKLTPTGVKVPCGIPVCVKFVPVAR